MNRRYFCTAVLGMAAATRLPENKSKETESSNEKVLVSGKIVVKSGDLIMKLRGFK